MGDMALKCSLCCDKSFPSKTALIEHLSNILENITCPICSNKWSSVAHLIEHLTLDECQPELSVQTLNLEINLASRNTETTTNHVVTKIDQNQEYRSMPVEFGTISINNHSNSFATSSKETVGTRGDESEESRMYMELRKQLLKPSIQTKEFKLVNDGGITRYVIVTEEDDDADMDPGSQIVTKQNNDGTISLTTVRDMKMETDTVIAPDNQETEENQEIYSCNTCGVSFTSVLEHIQNYHNDQDVVVEDSIEDTETQPGNHAPTAESNDPLSLEEQNMDKHAPRRMITETGDIVEAPLYFKAIDNSTPLEVKQEPVKKDNVVPLLETDSLVKEINRIGENGVPYHKVVIKEVEVDSEKVKVFNCMSCNIYVSTLDEFKSQPCKILKYHCPHCPVAYENSKSLCAHMKVHKNKPGTEILLPPVNFECEVCNTIFLTNKSLKLHKRMHDPIKSRPIQPPVESEKGGEVNATDQFICGVCDKVMPIEYRNIHQNSHKVVDTFNCDICNKKFQSCEYLEMHMNVHTMEKVPVNKQDKNHPYTCLYCDRRFARPHEKVKHERIHTGERPHSCEICGKSFRVAYCLTLHMRTHTGLRPYACSHCGKRFKAHSVYNHHLMTHSEVRAYKCPFCPKAFKTSVQLAGHKNSHTKPFSCQQCNRPFASLYAVRVHTETHARHNNLKFSCSVCGASYARAFALKDHIKQVHNREPDKSDNLTPVEADWKTTDAETEQVTKELPQVVEINHLGIINSNHSNELVVP